MVPAIGGDRESEMRRVIVAVGVFGVLAALLGAPGVVAKQLTEYEAQESKDTGYPRTSAFQQEMWDAYRNNPPPERKAK
jgi:hypothetical protein